MTLNEWIQQVCFDSSVSIGPLPVNDLGLRLKRVLWLSLFQMVDRGIPLGGESFTRILGEFSPLLSLDDRIDDVPILRKLAQKAQTSPRYVDFLSKVLLSCSAELKTKPWILPGGEPLRLWDSIAPGEQWAYELVSQLTALVDRKPVGGALNGAPLPQSPLESIFITLIRELPGDMGQHWKIYLWQNLLLNEGRTAQPMPGVKKALSSAGIRDYPIHRPLRNSSSACEFLGGVELLLKHLEMNPILFKQSLESTAWSEVFRECVTARQQLSKTEELPGTEKLWQQLLQKTSHYPGWASAFEALYLQYSTRAQEPQKSASRRRM